MLTEVHVPSSASDAVDLVVSGAIVLGGGTSLMPRLNDHTSPATELVSLRRAGLAGVSEDGSHTVLGAATTLGTIERDPGVEILHSVVRSIASVPVRNLATVAGNLFVPQPYGDLAAALVALDATAVVVDSSGEHELSVLDLLSSPEARGLVTAVTFESPASGAFRYHKAARRRFNSASIVTIAAVLEESEGVVSAARIALGGVAPRVIRAHAVEAALIGRPLDADSVAAAATTGLAELSPSDDAYASAWYRLRVFPVHLRRALLGH